MKIIIIGGAGTACVVAEQIIDANNRFGLQDELIGFAFNDDTKTEIMGLPVLSRNYFELAEKYEKYNDVRFLYLLYRSDKIKARADFRDTFCIPLEKYYNFIHPLAFVAESVEMGFGNIVLSSSAINSNVVMGNFNTLLASTLVAHDTILGNSNFLAAHTCLGSGIAIGDNNFFGINCTVRNKTIIGNNNLIGQASNVLKHIEDNAVVYGNPAKQNGYNDPNKECWG